MQSNSLTIDLELALATVLNNLDQLAQTESLRDSGGRATGYVIGPIFLLG